jgi:TatD DNase family protein
MLIDTHCHLNYAPLSDDVAATVARAHAAGVSRMVNIATTPDNFDQTLAAATNHNSVYASIGLHPCHADEHFAAAHYADKFFTALAHPKVVAVGETGLDFYHSSTNTWQQQSFEFHIAAAIQHNKALVVHCRNAVDAVEETLQRTNVCAQVPVIIHCFSGNTQDMQRFVACGAYISVAGIVTFKNAKELHAAVQLIPDDRLLIETDAPYLAPAPHRGKPCEVAYLPHTAAAIAELRQMSLADLADLTSQNAARVFGWAA